MMRSLFSGVSGLKTHQTKMDVIGNNIANVNTVAFKSSSTTFSEIMYQTLNGASGPSTTRGGINAKQIGLGVSMASTTTNISSPGSTQTTGDAFDLKITGDSFFVVSDGVTNYFTKAGAFTIDGLGNLVMRSTGYTVMGWQVDPTTGDIQKDKVSALRIMQEKNMTSPPEATTQAVCRGLLDKNSTNINGEKGEVMSLQFYDALGYSYSARFSIKADSAKDSINTGTYSVELVDILDSNSKSVWDAYQTANPGANIGQIFGVTDTHTSNYLVNSSGNYEYDGSNYYYDNGTIREQLHFHDDTGSGGDKYFTYDVNSTTVRVELTSVFAGMTSEAALAFDNTNNIGTDGSFTFSKQIYAYNLDFNESDGTFNYINNPGNSTAQLNLSVLGPNFENVTIDFSQTKWQNNGGTCTIGMEPGATDGTTGSGKKLGDLIGLSVDSNGKIYGSYDNGNTVLLGQIAVAVFANPAGLEKVGDNCYQTTLNSGLFDGIGQDITADGGYMTSGALEMSNVDLAAEFTEMITTQRGFQANSRIITTSDTLLEELINLKR